MQGGERGALIWLESGVRLLDQDGKGGGGRE